MNPVLSPLELAASLDELWSPRVLARVNDSLVKVARVQGEIVWHTHEGEDELFLVLRGRLVIQLDSGDVVLEEGEMFTVPRGVRHRPVAEEECLLLLVEPATTRHTGEVINERTRSLEEQMRPLPGPSR
ncbi:MAG: cupin domain-containing protein [Calditrichaeota bacterium]|nr:cupin domain-containing protein [Candidatus Cloacimonadota bacterium]MCA9787485.1 cupin domain-containing protein [Candidatus Cloacimonadota bacterium]MCB1046455.1 cupin domain-containing protein [Calditrichota bacterium]MCB9474885.1 cupin domain-containing protein [Candidatus Delongbacteria bacterium]